MSFQHKSTVYKILKIPNPFAQEPSDTYSADKAYADILKDKMKETNLWRLSAFVNLAFFFLSLIFFLVSINRQQTVPVLVNVMPSGESQHLGEVRQSNFQVPEAAILFQIRAFVSNLRIVSTDYSVIYDNIDDCFFVVTQSFTPILRQTLTDDSPFNQFGKIRRSVDIESVLLITGRSYAVNWTETSIDTSASQTTVKMRAVVTIRLVTPTNDTIKRNPLGIYIENFEMTEL